MGLNLKEISILPLPGVFPPVDHARPEGLLAYGGNLSAEMLLGAYSRGIFPWFSKGDPILWWSPDPRCILYPSKFHVSSRSRRKIRNSGFSVTFNKAFESVIRQCALTRGQDATWILPEMIEAYVELHRLGYAQSVEVWQKNELVGGLYGVCMGKAFFGESMFHKAAEASRLALLSLVDDVLKKDFLFIDCQQETPHMMAMGAETVERSLFLRLLAKALGQE